MKLNIQRDEQYLNNLKNILEINYGFDIKDIKKGDRGVEGETWIIYLKNNDKVFVKIGYIKIHKERMKKGIEVINYLENKNINNINSIIKTIDNKSFINFKDGILVVFKYIDGEIDFSISYKDILKILIPIYKLPHNNIIQRELFEVEKIINNYEQVINKISNNNDYEIMSIINKYKGQIFKDIENFKNINLLIPKNSEMFITHGDASVNVMKTLKQNILIDWDEALIAPIERDCWVFMNSEEKITEINKILKNNEIDYILSNEFLAFYAYKSYIIYLTDTIQKYIELRDSELLLYFENLINGWVRERLNSKIVLNLLK